MVTAIVYAQRSSPQDEVGLRGPVFDEFGDN